MYILDACVAWLRLVGLMSRGASTWSGRDWISAASESSFDSKTPRRYLPSLPSAGLLSTFRFCRNIILSTLLHLFVSPQSLYQTHLQQLPTINSQPSSTANSIRCHLRDFNSPTFTTHPADRIRNRGNHHTKWRCYKIPITVTVVVITTAAAPRANRAGAATPRPLPTPSTPAPWR